MTATAALNQPAWLTAAPHVDEVEAAEYGQ
jgi:hypothetical protein